MIFLPFFISSAIGILVVNRLFKKADKPNIFFHIFLATGIGLGISSHLTFYSFLILDRLMPAGIIDVHLVLLGALLTDLLIRRQIKKPEIAFPRLTVKNSALTFLIFFILVLVVAQGRFYPYGGWDAWQVWNFKAKFLLLSGDNWHDLFSPEIWRSSPHYPLLLPLINVWAWLFTAKPVDATPLVTSIFFTVLTAGLLSSALWGKTKNIFSLLPALLILTLPFFNLLATTQYCDIVLSFYLLAALLTLSDAQKTRSPSFAGLSGICTGFLTFTKPEGLVAALIISGLVVALTILSRRRKPKNFSVIQSGFFFAGLAVVSLPTFAFHVLYSPGNQTFINGLTSALKPVTWQRLQIIMGFLLLELSSAKWNGIWLLLGAGLLLGGKKPWTPDNTLIAGFLFLYFAVIVAYYEINTYFEIKWWLSVSLNRILFSLLPLVLFWIFSTYLTDEKEKN